MGNGDCELGIANCEMGIGKWRPILGTDGVGRTWAQVREKDSSEENLKIRDQWSKGRSLQP